LIAPPDRQDEARALSRYVACGGKFGIETVRRRKDGTLVDVSVMGTPVQYEDGQPAGYVIYRDISDRRRTEQALLENEAKFRSMADTIRRSELRYRSLFERAEYGIYRSTPDGQLVDANPALVRMLGYDSSRELMRLDFSSEVYLDPEEHDRLLHEIHVHGRILQEAQWRRRDGRPIKVRINAIATHRNGEPDGLEVIVEDVTGWGVRSHPQPAG
jgi:PAS domain S-box-containing protein